MLEYGHCYGVNLVLREYGNLVLRSQSIVGMSVKPSLTSICTVPFTAIAVTVRTFVHRRKTLYYQHHRGLYDSLWKLIYLHFMFVSGFPFVCLWSFNRIPRFFFRTSLRSVFLYMQLINRYIHIYLPTYVSKTRCIQMFR